MSFYRKNTLFISLVVSIIAVGIFFRFWQLEVIPPGIHYDEAYNGVDALKANETGDYKIFYPENTGREGLHINVEAFFIRIFGVSNFSLRFANALWGSLTIIGFFLLLRQLQFSRLSIFLGTFMISFSFWHLVFSRMAYRAIMVPLILVWMFYFFMKGIRNKKYAPYFFAASGALLGLGFYTYIAFRIVPLILVIIGILLLLTKEKRFRISKKGLTLFFLGLVVLVVPISIYFFNHPAEFSSRLNSVSIFNAHGMSFIKALWKSLYNYMGAFFIHGDNNPRHNYNSQPLLPAAWSVLFSIGLIISITEIFKTIIFSRRKIEEVEAGEKVRSLNMFYASILAQSTFWVMLIPGILSIEGVPHSLRIIGTIPAVFIMSILPIEYMLNVYRNIKKSPLFINNPWKKYHFLTIFLGIIAMVILGGISQVYLYFNVWAKDLRTMGAYERKLYTMGLLIKDMPVHKNNYVITAFNTAISSDRKQSSLKTIEYIAYPNIKNYTFYKPLDGRTEINCDDPMLVFLESDQWLRDQYKGKCSGLKQKRYSFDNNKYLFWVMNYD